MICELTECDLSLAENHIIEAGLEDLFGVLCGVSPAGDIGCPFMFPAFELTHEIED